MVIIVYELYLKKAVFFFFKVAWQELIHFKLGIFLMQRIYIAGMRQME